MGTMQATKKRIQELRQQYDVLKKSQSVFAEHD
jgi:hypothetical protein